MLKQFGPQQKGISAIKLYTGKIYNLELYHTNDQRTQNGAREWAGCPTWFLLEHLIIKWLILINDYRRSLD